MTSRAESIGAVVKALREAAGLTRAELVEGGTTADGSHVSLEMLAKVEQGKKQPSVKTLRAIAAGLGLSTAELSERASAWEVLASEGVAEAALRAATISGTLGAGSLTNRAAGSLAGRVVGGAVGGVVVGALAMHTARNARERKSLEDALHAKLSQLDSLSDAQLVAAVEALGMPSQVHEP